MSCFNCDKRTTKAVDTESRSFLWGDSKNPPVAWEQVCTPKSIGGLGIRPSAYFNKAAVAKLGWKIIMDHSNWWVQIVKNKYLKNHSFFETKKKSSDSIAWKGILDSRDLITKGMRWTIGTGKEVKFWTFNWIFDFPLINLLNDQQKATINWDANVSDFIAGNSWDKEKLLQVLDWEIVKQIMGIPIPINNQNDRCVWGPAANDKFSIKTATWIQCKFSEKHPQIKLINRMWKLNIPPKIKMFSWLLLRGRLKTKDRLSRF